MNWKLCGGNFPPQSSIWGEGVEVVETTTKFEFNLGFAKVSRSIKKIKK